MVLSPSRWRLLVLAFGGVAVILIVILGAFVLRPGTPDGTLAPSPGTPDGTLAPSEEKRPQPIAIPEAPGECTTLGERVRANPQLHLTATPLTNEPPVILLAHDFARSELPDNAAPEYLLVLGRGTDGREHLWVSREGSLPTTQYTLNVSNLLTNTRYCAALVQPAFEEPRREARIWVGAFSFTESDLASLVTVPFREQGGSPISSSAGRSVRQTPSLSPPPFRRAAPQP